MDRQIFDLNEGFEREKIEFTFRLKELGDEKHNLIRKNESLERKIKSTQESNQITNSKLGVYSTVFHLI